MQKKKNHLLKFLSPSSLLFLLTIIINQHSVRGIPLKASPNNCGYKSCRSGDPDKINVHIVSHSHWDVGWLKTVDDYFYGGVQYVIDTVLDELEKDPEKRFVFVETAFIWRWWQSREENDRQKFLHLIQSGQLEIIGGGWSMNDEATTHYIDLVDQFTWGLRFLNDTFGECARPRVGWQIDPFGHSRESASLFAQMGYDGVFFGRIDYQDKANREQTQSMEFVWNASANLGKNGQVFGVVLPNSFVSPTGFCFDILCKDEPIKDNKLLKEYNVDKKVDTFLELIHNQTQKYATNNLIITMGRDFGYQNAHTWFLNTDKLIKYVNARQEEGSRVNVFYSTPSCYLKALHETDRTWPVKTDDFFPYGHNPHSYWTGYFTSRPTFKYYIKYTNNILQVAKQLSVIGQLGLENEKNLEPLKRHQGEVQNHNAITGTETQEVTNDYIESLSTAVSVAQESIGDAYAQLIAKGSAPIVSEQYFCHYLNVSYCNITEIERSFVITAYNPLAHTVRSHIRVPVRSSAAYSVKGPDGQLIQSQLVPVPQQVQNNPEHKGHAENELVFGSDLPPLGFSSFFVQSTANNSPPRGQPERVQIKVQIPSQATELVIQNEYVRVTADANDGLLKSITNILENKTYSVRQNFYYYRGVTSNDLRTNRGSDAYFFRPDSTDPTPIGIKTKSKLVMGLDVQEIHQTFSEYVSQVIRLYKGEHGVEFEWQVGPVPVTDGFGKEVISRFDTNLDTEGLFYTDSNGREILQRKRNYRPTWNVNISEPIAANYYPVTTRIYIKEHRRDVQLTVVTDRPQGGSSIKDGSLELMVHRRLVGSGWEGLNETGVDGKGLIVRGKHRLLMTSITDASQLHRAVALILTLPPVITVTPLDTSVDEYRNNYRTTHSGLTSDLPGNVHLLTLEPWKDDTILLRLEHYFEKMDDPNGLSQPVTVNLKKLFTSFMIVNATETSLGANVWLQDVDRFKWTTEKKNQLVAQNLELFHPNKQYKWQGRHEDDHLDVTLEPMQIRTFIVTVTSHP